MSRPRPARPEEIAAIRKHIRMALAAIVRLQQRSPGAPWEGPIRNCRGFASLALQMADAAQHQAIYSPQALSQVNFAALNRAAATFATPAGNGVCNSCSGGPHPANDSPPW